MRDAAWGRLEEMDLADGRVVNDTGRRLRDNIETRTDELSTVMWRTLGEAGRQVPVTDQCQGSLGRFLNPNFGAIFVRVL